MLGFQLFYIFEGKHLKNHNLYLANLKCELLLYLFIIFQINCEKNTLFIDFLLIMKKVSHILNLHQHEQSSMCHSNIQLKAAHEHQYHGICLIYYIEWIYVFNKPKTIDLGFYTIYVFGNRVIS